MQETVQARGTLLRRIGVYVVLGCALVGVLLFRETSGSASIEHRGFVGIDGFKWTSSHTEGLLGILSALTAVGLCLYALARAQGFTQRRWVRRMFDTGLLGVLVLSAATWLYIARGVSQGHYVKAWDSFHYYMGAKYFPEVGYFEFYECIALADRESVGALKGAKIRDLRDYGYLSAERAADRTDCRKRFSDARWQQFVHDYELYQDMSGSLIRDMVKDRGFNGAPFHTFVASKLANWIPTSYRGLIFATLPDTLGVLALMALMSVTFGFRLTAICAIFFFTAFTDRAFYITGSFLRYLWFLSTGLALVALHKRRYALAGVAVSAAAMFNVFPILFFVGIAFRMAWNWLRKRVVTRAHRRFVAGAVAGALVMGALSISHGRGVDNYRAFLSDMGNQAWVLTRSRVGLRYDFLYRGETTESDFSQSVQLAELARVRGYFEVVVVVLALALFVLSRRLSDLEATLLTGITLFFALFATVEYYYGIYAFWVLLWVRHLRRPAITALVALPLAISALAYWVWLRSDFLAFCNNYLMSWGITLVIVSSVVALLAPDRFAGVSDKMHQLRRTARIATAALLPVIALLLIAWRPPSHVARASGPVLAFAGDVNLGRFQNHVNSRAGAEAALSEVSELAAADLSLVNLECVVASDGELGVDKDEAGPYYLRGRPETLNTLLSAGVDVVNTANNHSLDYGVEALGEQAQLLAQAGIGSVGTGPDREQACAPVLRWVEDVAVAFFGFDTTQESFAATEGKPGTCFLDRHDAKLREWLQDQFASVRKSAHLIVATIHWGPNGATRPQGMVRDLGRLLIAADADLVLGSSSHELQGVEVYRGRPIVYDAGNLLFDFASSEASGAVFSLVLSQGGVRQIRVRAVNPQFGKTSYASGKLAEEVLHAFRLRSAELGTWFAVVDGEGRLDLDPGSGAQLGEAPPANPKPALQVPPALSPPEGCRAASVPEGLGAEQQMGPLTLLGYRVSPRKLDTRGLVWVETYWRADTVIDRDLLIELEGRAKRKPTWDGTHEPCDWAWPTSRWQVGEIYRDYYAVRPPKPLPEGQYAFAVGVLDGKRKLGEAVSLGTVEVGRSDDD